MNSLSIDINGSIWLLLLLVIIAFTISYYYYKITVPPIAELKRKILIILRGLGLSLLLLLLFEPMLTRLTTIEKQPKLAVLIDNSKSMSLKDEKFDRKKELLKAIENSDFLSLGYENLYLQTFDNKSSEIIDFSPTDLSLNGQTTNLSSAINSLYDKIYEDNIEAILLITDGAYNLGTNPIYSAQDIAKPIFTIGIGDSLPPKDIAIESLIANDIAYINKPVPININLVINGFSEGNLKIDLYDNNELLSSQEFKIIPDNNSISAIFEFTPKTEGVHKLIAKVNKFDGEITYKNNTISKYINVLKNKKKITIFSGSPSPDLSFIYNLFLQDKSLTVKSFVQKDANSFYLSNPNDLDFKETEIFVLIGYPNNYSSNNYLKKIANELSKGKSLLFIASRDINYTKLRILEPYLPFNTVSSKPNEFLVIFDANPKSITNPILKITGKDDDLKLWNSLPPIFKTETFVKSKPESEILAHLKINNLPLKEPLMLSRNFANQKSIAFLSYGLYRWKLLGYAADYSKTNKQKEDLFSRIILNSMQWLSVDLEKKLVNVITSKKFYSSNEKIQFIGQVYDQSLNPIDDAVINVKVSSLNQTNNLVLNSLGNGRYEYELEGLNEGDYFYNAEVFYRGKNYGKDRGRFTVGELDLEYQDLQMKVKLLRNISNLTGGKFYTVTESKNFLDDLQSLKNFQPQPVSLKMEYLIWNNIWLIAVIILIFSTEWFIRKRSGLL